MQHLLSNATKQEIIDSIKAELTPLEKLKYRSDILQYKGMRGGYERLSFIDLSELCVTVGENFELYFGNHLMMSTKDLDCFMDYLDTVGLYLSFYQDYTMKNLVCLRSALRYCEINKPELVESIQTAIGYTVNQIETIPIN